MIAISEVIARVRLLFQHARRAPWRRFRTAYFEEAAQGRQGNCAANTHPPPARDSAYSLALAGSLDEARALGLDPLTLPRP